MNAKCVVLFSCLLTTATLSQASASILDTTTYGGHTYHLLDPKGWNESEAEAVSLGGHLVTINSAEEYVAIGLFKTVAMEYTLSTICGDCLYFPLWIGLNDSLLEGSFTWISGEPVTYTDWALGEPAGSLPDEDYVAVLVGARWSDLLADASAGFPASVTSDRVGPAFGIVEIGSSIPAPSTILLIGLGIVGLGWFCRRPESRVGWAWPTFLQWRRIKVGRAHPTRLWRSVKYEDIYPNGYATLMDAKQGLTRYFAFYNRLVPK